LEKKILGIIPAFALGPRKTKKDPGKPRKTQENQQRPRKTNKDPGKPRKTQEHQERPMKTKKDPGKPRKTQEVSEYFTKLDDRCILCNEIIHTTLRSTSQEDRDVQITVGTRVGQPQIPGHTNYARSVRQPFPSNTGFTLFPRDGSSGNRTIPNVTFTVCNGHEFHDLATLPTQVIA
jgi:hypothetical protein